MRTETGFCADDQILLDVRKLRRAEVHHWQVARVLFFTWGIVPGVRHDSNDRQRNAILIGVANGNWIVDLFASRVGAGKKFLRGELDDHDRSRTSARVRRSEIAAPQHPHTKRAKEARGNNRHGPDWLPAVM